MITNRVLSIQGYDGLYDQKAFYTVKMVFYSSSMNDSEFINY